MIKTIKLRDLIKYLVGLITVIFISVYSTRFFSNSNRKTQKSFFNINFKDIIERGIIVANYESSTTEVKLEKYSSTEDKEVVLLKEPVEEQDSESVPNTPEEENESDAEQKIIGIYFVLGFFFNLRASSKPLIVSIMISRTISEYEAKS